MDWNCKTLFGEKIENERSDRTYKAIKGYKNWGLASILQSKYQNRKL